MEIITMTVVHHLGTWRDVKWTSRCLLMKPEKVFDGAVNSLLHRDTSQFGERWLALLSRSSYWPVKMLQTSVCHEKSGDEIQRHLAKPLNVLPEVEAPKLFFSVLVPAFCL